MRPAPASARRLALLGALLSLGAGASCAPLPAPEGTGSSDGIGPSDTGPADTGTPGTGDPAWYGDVEIIVVASCAGCHADGEIAPFPLGTFAEAAPMATAMADAVAARRMPPWLASDDCNEYRYDPSLTDDQVARIQAWAEAGAPAGDEALAAGTVPNAPSLSRVDFELPMPEPYTPQVSPDDYRCILLDWPETEFTWVTGFQVNPGDPATVHHVVMYLAPPEEVAAYRAADEAEDGVGYTCFGGPGVSSQEDSQWLGGWAPGAVSGDFPNGTGIGVEPGSLVVMQMHYNTADAEAAPDQSSIAFMVEPEVENPAYIQPWADPSWLDGDGMDIPAGATDATHSFSYRIPYTFRIHTANLHMHTHGTRAKLWVSYDDDTEDCLVEIPDWDFNWQRTYVLTDPLTVENPTIHIECHWENPTGEDMDWGEGTGDEMCLGTMLLSY